jgi:anti-sigma regulatory factor (Ser/Thr protein kinase)
MNGAGHDARLLSADAEAVGDARRAARRFAEGASAAAVERLALIVSELVTNAVVHAGTELELSFSRRGEGILVAVTDGGPAFDPAARFPESHRGLRIIEALAERPVVARSATGKTVSVLVPV